MNTFRQANGGGGDEGGWRTVPMRSMGGAAFGKKETKDDTEHAARRQANADAEALVRFREQKAKREAEEKAHAEYASATAFTSDASYPALGGGASMAPKPKTTTTLQFKQTVAAMKAREEEAELAAQALTADEYTSSDFAPSGLRQRRFLAARCYDDGLEDYDGPEEESDALNTGFMDDDDASVGEGAVDDNEAAAGDGEFNAELAAVRRRGDKGVW